MNKLRDAKTATGKEPVLVVCNYKPAPYPDDVVNNRHFIINEELPESTCRGSELQVFVRKVNSPSEFWINLFGTYYSKKLASLYADIRNFYEEHHTKYLLPNYAVTTNQFCVCMYRNEWHRVRIVHVDDDGLVEVVFIDSGGTVRVTAENLRFMHTKFSDFPRQSFLADIPDIKPRSSQQWQTSVCEFFRKETAEKMFSAKVMNVIREKYSVSLILYDFNGNSVSEKLVSNNLAETPDFDSADILVNQYKPSFDTGSGTCFVKMETIPGIPDTPRSIASSVSETFSDTRDAPVHWRIIDHKDVTIKGKQLLLVTMESKFYFILSDFLHAFVGLHEHLVLILLETFPNRVFVEKMEYKDLKILFNSLRGRRVPGLDHVANTGIIPNVHLLPVKAAGELLAFLRVDGSERIILRNFVASLSYIPK